MTTDLDTLRIHHRIAVEASFRGPRCRREEEKALAARLFDRILAEVAAARPAPPAPPTREQVFRLFLAEARRLGDSEAEDLVLSALQGNTSAALTILTTLKGA